MIGTRKYNLARIAEDLFETFPSLTHAHLFGSRLHGTRSFRSDIDVLLESDDFIRSADLRQYMMERCPPLDPFLVTGARAVSCINESYIEAGSREELFKILQAVCFWTRESRQQQVNITWDAEVALGVVFSATTLPNVHIIEEARETIFADAEEMGLPVEPYLGSSAEEVVEFLIKIMRNMVATFYEVEGRRREKAGWSGHLTSEYDFQDLFSTVVKPWLPGLGREEVALSYDGQKKKADFNLFGSQIIIEMKYVDGPIKKTSVLNTLEGLASFYKQHPNVRVALFPILVNKDVDLDDRRWESDFTYQHLSPAVRTIIIRNHYSKPAGADVKDD